MPSLHDQLTEQFYRWERRGRGWDVFNFPVSPEPPFVPFYGHYPEPAPSADDGRRPTALSSFVKRLSHKLSPTKPPLLPPVEPEPQPEYRERTPVSELQLTLP